MTVLTSQLRWIALVAFLLCGAALGQSVDFELYTSRDAAQDRLDQMMTLIEELRGEIDRTVFDVEELAFELAFEPPEAIVDWVVQNIAFEPYEGLLRGQNGTLRARAGNALDQATLLAQLLNDAGYESRIAVGTLSDADATTLLARSLLPREAAPPIGDVGAMQSILRELAVLAGDDEQRLLALLEETVASPAMDDVTVVDELLSTVGEIESALEGAGVQLGSNEPQLLEETKSYAWVEFRETPSDPWTSVHPTGLQPTSELAAEQIIEGSIPAELRHDVRIQAWIESKTGSDLERQPVMAAWERPVANAATLVLSYASFPNSGNVTSLETFDVNAIIENTEVFAPYFMGRLAEGAKIFDLNGRVVAPDVANNVAAGVFREVARATEQATGAIGSLGGDAGEGDDLVTLSGHGIDITWISPGGRETLDRRWILDRIGAANRLAGSAEIDPSAPDPAGAIVGRHRIMIVNGDLPPGFLLDRALARMLEARPFYAFMIDRMFDPSSAENLPDNALGGDPGMDLMVAFHAFDRAIEGVSAGPGYRPDAAAIVASERVAASPDTDFVHSIDIPRNPRRILTADADSAGAPTFDVRAAIRRGVWETIVERQMVQSITASGTVVAAADVLAPYRVLLPDAQVDADALDISAIAAQNIARDLERGSIVLLGRDSEDRTAWWRIDPETGTTLGITSDGRGQAAVEYEIQLADNALNLINGIKSLKECQGKGGLEEACCLVQAHINNVAGLGFGGAIGAVFGSGVGLAVGILTSTKYTSINFAGGMGFQCPSGG